MSARSQLREEAWIAEEARMSASVRRVFSRALRRPVHSIGIALLLTGSCVLARAIKAPRYDATLYLRLVEGELSDPSSEPRPPAAIREYVSDVVLSRGRLEQLMRKYHLSSALLARDRSAAIESFREDIGIEVSRNYFIYDRQPDDPPRTAQIVLSLSGSDAERTRAILHDLGAAILEKQAEQRGSRLVQARALLDGQLRSARARVRSLQERIASQLGAASASGRKAMGAVAQIATLERELQGALEQVRLLERRSESVSFSLAAERKSLGLNLELFDESVLTSSPHLSPIQLLILGVLVFPVLLSLVLALVGAFDDRVYGLEDLDARSLPHIGALPSLAGDDVGALGRRGESYNSAACRGHH